MEAIMCLSFRMKVEGARMEAATMPGVITILLKMVEGTTLEGRTKEEMMAQHNQADTRVMPTHKHPPQAMGRCLALHNRVLGCPQAASIQYLLVEGAQMAAATILGVETIPLEVVEGTIMGVVRVVVHLMPMTVGTVHQGP